MCVWIRDLLLSSEQQHPRGTPQEPNCFWGREHWSDGIPSCPQHKGQWCPLLGGALLSPAIRWGLFFLLLIRLDFCHDMRPLIGCSLCFSRQKSICSTHTKYKEHRRLRRDQNHQSNLRCGMLSPNSPLTVLQHCNYIWLFTSERTTTKATHCCLRQICPRCGHHAAGPLTLGVQIATSKVKLGSKLWSKLRRANHAFGVY